MSEDSSAVGLFVGAIGDSLESNVLAMLEQPAVGWLSSVIGLGGGAAGGGDPLALQKIGTTLTGMQTELGQILGEIGNLKKVIIDDIAAASFSGNIHNALDAVSLYQSNLTAASSALPDTYADYLDLLASVQTALVSPADGTTGYLPAYLSANLRYYSDGSALWASLYPFFQYYNQIQALLMQMAVDAAHQGQPAPQSPILYPGAQQVVGYPPPNYQGAGNAYTQYIEQAAQQLTFVPFPTTGVGSLQQHQNAFGVDQIVFDRTTNVAWGFRNFANTYGSQQTILSGTAVTDLPESFWITEFPDVWMLRVPTYAEMSGLRESFTDSSGQVLSSTAIGAAMQNVGFDLTMPAALVSLPYATAEVLDSSNWHYLNVHQVKIAGTGGAIRGFTLPARYDTVADGYWCDKFYDFLNDVPVTMQLSCPVSVAVTMDSDVATSAVLTDIGNATQASWSSSLGTAPAVNPAVTGYVDVLFIYQLANAHPPSLVNTDPPVEEPSSLQISLTRQSPDGSAMQFSASGSFQRFDFNAKANVPVMLPITAVYWSVGGAGGPATIDQNGVLLWTRSGSVTVTAGRGTQTSSMTVTTPAAFTPALTPSGVNIYPRAFKTLPNIPPEGVAVAFNGQIIWSDGSTSSFGDDEQPAPTQFANGNAIPPFTFAFAEANGHLALDQGLSSTFTIPAGTNGTQTFQINVVVNGETNLTDHAVIRIS